MRGLVLCAVLCAACAGGGDRPGVVTRDSAGIRIVESASPAWGDTAGWRLTDEPIMRIGSAEGMPEYELFQVRGVAQLSDGRIAVVNGGSQEVRFYGQDGRFLGRMGGGGEGPGEFRFPRSIWVLPGDTMLVADIERFSVFDRNYRFVRTEPFGTRMRMQRLSDGSFAGLAWAAGVDPMKLGQVRPPFVVVRTRADGSADTLATVSGDDVFRMEWNNGISQLPPPFGLSRLLVAHGLSLYTGDGAAFEVVVLDTAGTFVRIMRRPDLARPVTSELVEQWKESQLALAPSDTREQVLDNVIRGTAPPERQPEWNALFVDAPGDVWVRRYSFDGSRPTSWTVFDPEGRWLGEVGMPASFDVREIGRDYVLGVRTDSIGVEYVERYGIRKD